MQFLMWYDDSKKETADKIRRALDAFRERFGYAATLVWVSEGQAVPIAGVEVEPKSFIRMNNFWIGQL
jgi:hypothetical protein